MADIPGIIEGAAEGKGLGLRFLRHIERNSILLFLVPADSEDVLQAYEVLLDELRRYNPQLLDKQRVLAISKADLVTDEDRQKIQDKLPKDIPSIVFSAHANINVDKLKDLLWQQMNKEQ